MLRFLLAPRWLALHAALVAIVVSFTVLGWWQLDAFRAEDEPPPAAAARQAPAELAEVAAPGEPLPADALQRPVTVSGRYDADSQLLVPGRELDGRRGFLVVTPLLATGGGVVPVHRGWVPAADAPATVPGGGRVTVTGTLQVSEGESSARTELGGPVRPGELPFIATPELMLRLPYSPGDLYDGYLLLTGQEPPAAPAPVPVEAADPARVGVSPLRNLSYAAQWWVFAGAAVVFWGLLVRRAVADRRTERSQAEDAEHDPQPVG